MSSYVPSNNSFSVLLSFLNDYSEKSGYCLVGCDLIGAGNQNVNEMFVERLLNLAIKSVDKQYKQPVQPSTEIYTPDFMPLQFEGITLEVCLKQCEHIAYQIEHEEIDHETFSKLQGLQFWIVKEMFKKQLSNNKDYQDAPWSMA